MAVRKLKPVTPGQRHKVIGTFEDITASVPEKSLVYGKRSARYTKAGLVKGQKNAFKKAIVTLKEGETIDFYSNI